MNTHCHVFWYVANKNIEQKKNSSKKKKKKKLFAQ